MRKVYTSFKTVSRAYKKVRKELADLGLLWDGSKLDRVQCFHAPFAPLAALWGSRGWYDRDKKTITFTSVYLPIAPLGMDLCPKATVVDVLRHEFAHAIADLYSKAVSRGGTFRAAFGGDCGDNPSEHSKLPEWEGTFVSGYAKKSTEEDFAETFMLYVKHKRKIPAKFARNPAIRKKWNAVGEIVRRVAASRKS